MIYTPNFQDKSIFLWRQFCAFNHIIKADLDCETCETIPVPSKGIAFYIVDMSAIMSSKHHFSVELNPKKKSTE